MLRMERGDEAMTVTLEKCEAVIGWRQDTHQPTAIKCNAPAACELGAPFTAYLCADCCRRMMERGEVTRWRDMPPGKRWHKEKP